MRFSFQSPALTRFGGLALFQRFVHRLGVRGALSDTVRFPQRNNRYSISESILALVYPILLGVGRIRLHATAIGLRLQIRHDLLQTVDPGAEQTDLRRQGIDLRLRRRLRRGVSRRGHEPRDRDGPQDPKEVVHDSRSSL